MMEWWNDGQKRLKWTTIFNVIAGGAGTVKTIDRQRPLTIIPYSRNWRPLCDSSFLLR